MKTPPLVSVIIPSYQHSEYIQQAVESVMNQSYTAVELIVIDDGSSDGSPELLKKLADQHEFRLVCRENRGLSHTLNEGIELAKGEYICICASDDYFLQDKLKAQSEFMESNPQYAACYGKAIHFDDKGSRKTTNASQCYSGKIFYRLLHTNFVPAVTQMYRREIFNEVGGFNPDLMIEDWDMLLRVAWQHEIGFLNQPLAMRREHEASLSNPRHAMRFYQNEKLILESWEKKDPYRKHLPSWHVRWFCQLAESNPEEASLYLGAAWKKFYKKRVWRALRKFYSAKK